MFDSISTTPIWTWPAGVIVLFLATKYLWPVMKQSVETQVTQGRTESGLLRQALERADKAEARADAAELRADVAQETMHDLKNQVQLLTWQLQSANQKLDALEKQMSTLQGKT